MGMLPLWFSILFIVMSAISLIVGVAIFLAKPERSANRLFFVLCASMSVWCLGFAVSVVAPTREVCLLWRRIAAVGWGTMFSVMVHFALTLTERTDILSKRWFMLPIYFPAVVTVYVFSLSQTLSQAQYNLVRTENGWMNVAVNNGYDWFFYIYYAYFSVMTCVLLINWLRESDDPNVKKQARMILISCALAVVLGSVTDIFGTSLIPINLPQMAPVFFIIPLLTLSYCFYKYQMIGSPVHSENEEILKSSDRARILNILSIIYLWAAIFYFIAEYFFGDQKGSLDAVVPSIILLLLGALVRVANWLKLSKSALEGIYICIVCVTVPALSLNFLQYGSVTIWAASLIPLILAVLFNRRIVIVFASFFVIFTQALIWLVVPRVTVVIDSEDYFVRMAILVIGIGVSLYVNNVYALRLKENAQQISFQKLVSELTADFVGISALNKADKIDEMLMQLGTCFDADRVFLWIDDPMGSAPASFHSCANTQEGRMVCEEVLPPEKNFSQLSVVLVVNSPDAKKTKPVEPPHPVSPLSEKAKAYAVVPVVMQQTQLGVLGIESRRDGRVWSDWQIDLLKTIANVVADALVKVRAESRINFLAYYDHLTCLPNRILFEETVNREIGVYCDAFGLPIETTERKDELGIMFVDLDSFKSINDTFGHGIGDQLIKQIAKKLSDCVRRTDAICRLGGDEFLIMMEAKNGRQELIDTAESIMQLFCKPFIVSGQELFVTASAGISLVPQDGTNTDTLIKNADIAMYKAKEMGKSQYAFCSQAIKDDVMFKNRLSNNLYRALERGELVVYYQPQVDLHEKRIVGMEALLRWNHPELGRVSPAVFIPLAEQTGLIYPIGEWVLRQACAQNKKWQDEGIAKVRVAVNISVNQLRNPKFVGMVDRVLRETGLDPQYLELEVTEGVAIKEPGYIVETLFDLKQLGVCISIDDFGTEYSSLSRLKLLPIDRIKMDMQFIHGIETNEKDRAISTVLISLAKSLSLKVIAEGVETKSQLEFLSAMNCDEVQGFIFFKPMPASETEHMLLNEPDYG